MQIYSASFIFISLEALKCHIRMRLFIPYLDMSRQQFQNIIILHLNMFLIPSVHKSGIFLIVQFNENY